MYTPPSFRLEDERHVRALMRAHSFATLIAVDDAGAPEIAHVPVLFDAEGGPHGRLRAHVARSNPMARLAIDGRPLVAVFHGPHAYVSAAWYGEPTKQVPTWNYVVVHAHGRARGAMERDELRALLADLTAENEPSDAWRFDALDPALGEGLLRGIVGFSIVLDRVEAKAKLSQNRAADDQARVVAALDAAGAGDVAGWMRTLGIGS